MKHIPNSEISHQLKKILKEIKNELSNNKNNKLFETTTKQQLNENKTTNLNLGME